MIRINVVLAIFNLLPIPPLDGSKILAGIIPYKQQWLHNLETYGMIILMVLVFFTNIIGNILNFIITPIVNFLIVNISSKLAAIF
jgi:Zn-dependent protease